jgi:hypothetical protein
VAFFAGAAFLAVVVFFVTVFLGAAEAGALVLVTRPDFVLPRTRETSASTAGAGAAVFLGLPALALGLAAALVAAFFGAALVTVALVALVVVAFLVVVALVF